ncbi:G-protein coupled receptor GRL101-like [Babylonia areolata]|uniref:G-protein coupled receptor GRL101-like n=1 Tax=Babylonia areolata TaxID=304850 RepID=UPI003FD2E1D8
MSSFSGFSVFVINLNMADFLMGVYISIIGAADERYRGRYLYCDDTWKSSVTCKVSGFLSLLSSEVSALLIWLITLDRFIVIHFPFSTLRFQRTSATMACSVTWLVGWFLALVPLLPMTSHWEFYSQSGICIPLPVTRQEFKGKVYSFSVLIVLNFALFLFISVGQALIFWSIQRSALKANTTKMSRDMTIAGRLISVAVTDFLCWFPIGICGMLALKGTPIPREVSVALAVFVLPLNSAVNPFMYTFNTLAEKRRKMNEDRLVKWLESHVDLIMT